MYHITYYVRVTKENTKRICTLLANCLRTVELMVGFNPISKAVKYISAIPASAYYLYNILIQDIVTLVIFEAEFISGQYTIYILSTIERIFKGRINRHILLSIIYINLIFFLAYL